MLFIRGDHPIFRCQAAEIRTIWRHFASYLEKIRPYTKVIEPGWLIPKSLRLGVEKWLSPIARTQSSSPWITLRNPVTA